MLRSQVQPQLISLFKRALNKTEEVLLNASPHSEKARLDGEHKDGEDIKYNTVGKDTVGEGQ